MNLACLWSSVSWALLSLSSSFLLLNLSSLSPSQCPCDKIFLHVSTDSTLQCEDIRSVQEIFVHATYVPFHQLPSVGLPGFFWKFSCTRRTYHFTNYQVWGFPVFSGSFCARNIHTISPTTKCGASRFFQEVFVHATYVPFHQLPSVGLPGFFRKFSCTRRTYHAQPTILGLTQARPNYLCVCQARVHANETHKKHACSCKPKCTSAVHANQRCTWQQTNVLCVHVCT